LTHQETIADIISGYVSNVIVQAIMLSDWSMMLALTIVSEIVDVSDPRTPTLAGCNVGNSPLVLL
jgi:hypothetical protein